MEHRSFGHVWNVGMENENENENKTFINIGMSVSLF